jgi:hypothetical protein
LEHEEVVWRTGFFALAGCFARKPSCEKLSCKRPTGILIDMQAKIARDKGSGRLRD